MDPTRVPSRRASTRSSSSAAARAASSSPTASALRRAPCRHLGRRVARRHVPALAVLPAPAVVDQAVRPEAADGPRLPALRLEQPDRRRARAAGDAGRVHGRLVLLPVAAGDGGEPRRVRRARRDRGPLRLPLGADAPRGRRPTARVHRSRRPTASTAPETSSSRSASRAVDARPRPASSTPPLRRDARRGDATPASGVFIIGKQNSGFELASGLAAVGLDDHRARSPSPAKTLGPDEVAGRRPGALRAAVRGQLPGLGVSILDASIDRIEHARRRPPRRRSSGPTTAGRSSVDADEVIAATGFTCPLLDLPDLGRHDLRPGQAARA